MRFVQAVKDNRRKIIFLFLFLLLLSERIAIAHFLSSDEPGDSIVYTQIARNVLEQHSYSLDTEKPYSPTIVKLPGYPLFLAAIYSVFGHGNAAAVRIIQAIIDSFTCLLVWLIACMWCPDVMQKKRAALAAFLLATICPFTAIYTATILTETLVTFLIVAMMFIATLAWQSEKKYGRLALWFAAGALAGYAVMIRPDSGLFAAGVGFTIVINGLFFERGVEKVFAKRFIKTFIEGAAFSLAFLLLLVPWIVRNEKALHIFQPLGSPYENMPGEFVPRGYFMWLRTWLYDSRDIKPMMWDLDSKYVDVNKIPASAFDSEEEKARVASLFDKYNNKPPTEGNDSQNDKAKPSEDEDDSSDSADDDSKDDDDSSADDNDNDQSDENEEDDDSDEAKSHVKMTPEIDAAFMQLARERIARAPFRYYVLMPAKKAISLWFDTHSDYYPFEGEFYPSKDWDDDANQGAWLVLFIHLTWVYTLLGLYGAFWLLKAKTAIAKRWLLFILLLIFPRLMFLSTMENPEPRYVVEFFPIVCILGGLALAQLSLRLKPVITDAGAESEMTHSGQENMVSG